MNLVSLFLFSHPLNPWSSPHPHSSLHPLPLALSWSFHSLALLYSIPDYNQPFYPRLSMSLISIITQTLKSQYPLVLWKERKESNRREFPIAPPFYTRAILPTPTPNSDNFPRHVGLAVHPGTKGTFAPRVALGVREDTKCRGEGEAIREGVGSSGRLQIKVPLKLAPCLYSYPRGRA